MEIERNLSEELFKKVGGEVVTRSKPLVRTYLCASWGAFCHEIVVVYNTDGSISPRKLTKAITTAADIVDTSAYCAACFGKTKLNCSIAELAQSNFPTENGI